MVYIVHNHMVARGSKRVPKFDFSEAEKYGQLVNLFEDDVDPLDATGNAKLLSQRLERFTEQDYLLLVGSPVLIALAFAIAAEYTDGRVKVLQWSGRDGYIPVDIKF